MEKSTGPGLSPDQFYKKLGISKQVFYSAIQYCKFVEEEPELSKLVGLLIF